MFQEGKLIPFPCKLFPLSLTKKGHSIRNGRPAVMWKNTVINVSSHTHNPLTPVFKHMHVHRNIFHVALPFEHEDKN